MVSKQDRRLGKGLGALLGDYLGEEEAQGAHTRMLPVGKITPNPFQPRREFGEEELEELTASIRENGLLQPIVVRPADKDSAGAWELVAGERRWRAVTRLKWREVPAIVRDVDDRTLLVLALVENLQRSELSPMEEAESFQRLSQDFSLSQQQIAEMVGRNRSTVANAMRLLQLPASVRQLVSEGLLTAGHARPLLSLDSPRRMGEVARQAVDENWSVREMEARIKRVRPGRKPAPAPAPEKRRAAAERRLEEELQRALGTAARIRSGRDMKGRIEIPFYGPEDFERIYELLAGRPAADVVS
jgi:ParB family chromosome partitioning protein